MIDQTLSPTTDTTSLVTVFRRLFENEFATLDGIAISARTPEGMEYLDETVLLGRMLTDDEDGADGDVASQVVPGDPVMYDTHRALYAASPETDSVVGGMSRHLRALQLEGMSLPAATSMMRKRGVTDLAEHLVEPDDLVGKRLEATIAAARQTAIRNEMAHILVLTANGTVVVGAPTRIEAMAHWHNVEFAARVECMRVEELDVHLVES